MRTWTMSLVGAAAIAMGVGVLLAQPAETGGPGGGGGTRSGGPASRPFMHHGDPNAPGGPGAGGFPHVFPPFVAEKLNLTDDQRRQLHEFSQELSKEVMARLEKILTPDQMKVLQEMQPPRPGQGPGGPGGQGGPGGGQGGGHGGGPSGGPGGGGPGGPHSRPAGE